MSHFPFRKKDGVLHILVALVVATLIAPLIVGTAPIGLNVPTLVKGGFLLTVVIGTVILITEFWKVVPRSFSDRALVLTIFSLSGSLWGALVICWFRATWPGYVFAAFLGVPLAVVLFMFLREQITAFIRLHRHRAQS
ncbi:MAG: hypothetical protein RL150_19 [Candidatus Parcubacteria bacterium]|jgi:hypothetical protein